MNESNIFNIVNKLNLLKKINWLILIGIFISSIILIFFSKIIPNKSLECISNFSYDAFCWVIVLSCIKYAMEKIEKRRIFKIIDSLEFEERKILQAFAISNSFITEIKNDIDAIQKLNDIGFSIYSIGALYSGNFREKDGCRYCDTMSKVKLENEETLKYIKEYFKDAL